MRIEEESRIFYFSRNNNLNYKNCTIDYISFSYFRAEKFIFIFVPAFRVKLFQSFHWRKKSKSYPVFPLLSLFKKKSANTAVNVTRNVSNLQLKSNTAWTLFKKKKAKIANENKRKSRLFSHQRFNSLLNRGDYTSISSAINQFSINPQRSMYFVLYLYTNQKYLRRSFTPLHRSNIYQRPFYRDISTCTHRLIPAARQLTT